MPLSSIVLNLEKKISDLDQMIHAEMVMEDEERNNRKRGIEECEYTTFLSLLKEHVVKRHSIYLTERVETLTQG